MQAITIAACLLLAASACLTQAIEFKELKGLADTIESAAGNRPKDDPASRLSLYKFIGEPKGPVCMQEYLKVAKSANDFRVTATSFLEDMSASKNWLARGLQWNSYVNRLKGISKFDPWLYAVVMRYQPQVEKNKLTREDVECDAIKLQIRHQHEILFVLQTDLKQTVHVEPALANWSIFNHLRKQKFLANHNFFDNYQLTARQKELLLNFYMGRVDERTTEVGDAIEQVDTPDQFVVGHIMDTCQAVSQQGETLRSLELDFEQVCPKSMADPAREKFPVTYKQGRFNHTYEFCHDFMAAI